MEDDRKLAIDTLEGIERIARALPRCQVILGLSNISFGLKAAARHVLNSVFLDEAVKRGMTGAIIHVSKIKPLHAIPEDEAKVALDLIYDRRSEGYDPLQAFLALFEGREVHEEKVDTANLTIEEKLHRRIVDGDRNGLGEDLDGAMETRPPLDIINETLLGGMKEVGELFGSGKMQLPFVLQSAETMKAAVAHLEPHMEKADSQSKGTVVLATVKGDVHDIGKNLVDIILTNNGYNVVNLGIKQPIANIVDAAREHKARRHRHVGPAGEVDRRHAREPGRDDAREYPGSRHAGRRRADPRLCRGGLRRRLWRRPRGLCPRRLRRAEDHGQGGQWRVRRLRRGHPGETQKPPGQQPQGGGPRRQRRAGPGRSA